MNARRIVRALAPTVRYWLNRVIPAALGVDLLLEALKYVNILAWPRFEEKIAREYGVFQYSVTPFFLGFFTSLLVLAGAEWAAPGLRLGPAWGELKVARAHLEKDEGE